MTDLQNQVFEFHIASNSARKAIPALNPEVNELLARLIREELGELVCAQGGNDLVGIADALGDLLYVIYGAAVSYGIDMEPITNEIHRSNMTKIEGAEIRKDGKILKGPHYKPPKLRRILLEQGWKP